jgi:hypothetical protein
MSDLLGNFHKRDTALQNSTAIEVNDVLDVCICLDGFKNQNEKRVKIRLSWEMLDTCLDKSQTKTMIKALQKLVKEL